ncbi:DUF4174 domain-containing protein [Aureimonas leprariae]|nr:DUF4174 domain-containing protein [Aureimonas leprariae]
MVAATVLGMAGAASGEPLEGLRWQKRLLLVFTQGDTERERRQRDALPDEGLRERDMLLIRVPQDGEVSVPGVGAVPSADIRSAYGVADAASFTVILVGKDGGIKRRSSEPIAARDLFGTVDAMPMRRQETRGN